MSAKILGNEVWWAQKPRKMSVRFHKNYADVLKDELLMALIFQNSTYLVDKLVGIGNFELLKFDKHITNLDASGGFSITNY